MGQYELISKSVCWLEEPEKKHIVHSVWSNLYAAQEHAKLTYSDKNKNASCLGMGDWLERSKGELFRMTEMSHTLVWMFMEVNKLIFVHLLNHSSIKLY